MYFRKELKIFKNVSLTVVVSSTIQGGFIQPLYTISVPDNFSRAPTSKFLSLEKQ